MEIKLIKYPYKDYEVGEIIDLGDEKNSSMVSIGRAVWVEEEKKKTTKTTTQTQDDTTEAETESPEETETKKAPARGPDGKFVSTKDAEEPKKKDF
jgi:hypothetical protein